MKIDFDTFLKWAEKHCADVVVTGKEIKINSIFEVDTKQHLWCNPSKNAYHCWKTDKSGNLFDLASQISGCSYQEAVDLFASDNDLRELEARLDKFFADKEKVKEKKVNLTLPPNTFLISETDNFHGKAAEKYIKSRCLPLGNLMVCISGKYRNRIIIPYYGAKGELIYWNSRDLSGKGVRYLGPDVKTGVAKGDVLFMEVWPAAKSKIYLTEGEFDAMSLNKCGFFGCAVGGKVVSDKQVDLLREYEVCICFDTDKSGSMALNKIGDKLISNSIKVSYVRPPNGIKDWNKMLVDIGENLVHTYIIDQEKPFTSWTSNILRFKGTQ